MSILLGKLERVCEASEEQSVSPAAEADHSDVDCFLLVFLSHGEDDHVYTYDDKISIKDVTALFKGDKCRSLVGKPKIFILQVGGASLTPLGSWERLR